MRNPTHTEWLDAQALIPDKEWKGHLLNKCQRWAKGAPKVAQMSTEGMK